MFNCVRFISFLNSNKLVFQNGGQEGGSIEQQKRLDEAVESIISEDLKKIDEIGDNPEELEKIVEAALNRLGDLYKDKIRDKQTAQKHALELLVNRACDLNGNGKIDTKEEKAVKAEVEGKLDDIYGEIDDVASDARSAIDDASETAKGMKEDITKLADSSDPKVKKAYEEFKEAEKKAEDYRKFLGLAENIPPTKDNIILALHKLAHEDKNKFLKIASAVKDIPMLADTHAPVLQALERGVSAKRDALVGVVDNWYKVTVEKAKKGNDVDAKDLAKAILDAKTAVLAKGRKEHAESDAERESEAEKKAAEDRRGGAEKAKDTAEDERDAARDKAATAKGDLDDMKENFGLDKNKPLSENEVILALNKMVHGEKEIPKELGMSHRNLILAYEKGQLAQVAKGVIRKLEGYQARYDLAIRILEEKEAKLARAEGSLNSRAKEVEVAEEKAERRAKAIEGVPYDEVAKTELADRGVKGKKQNEAERAWAQTQRMVERGAAEKTLADAKATAKGVGEKAKGILGGAAKVAKRLGGEAVRAASEAKKAEVIEHPVREGENMTRILKKYYPADQVNGTLAREIQKLSLGGVVATLKSGKESLIKPGQTIKIPKTVTYTKDGKQVTVERKS